MIDEKLHITTLPENNYQSNDHALSGDFFRRTYQNQTRFFMNFLKQKEETAIVRGVFVKLRVECTNRLSFPHQEASLFASVKDSFLNFKKQFSHFLVVYPGRTINYKLANSNYAAKKSETISLLTVMNRYNYSVNEANIKGSRKIKKKSF